jgi:hypothetical protein
MGVNGLERLILLGYPLSRAVIVNLERCLLPTAKVISPALAGLRFGRFTIITA